MRFAAFTLFGFALAQFSGLARLSADPQVPANIPPAVANSGVSGSEYSQRVVAYIHGNIPVTREDLGEFLIARQGASKLENLVNQKIIEHAAKTRGFDVTPQEIEAALEDDLTGLNIKRPEFVKVFLKQYNKTLYEWKMDVIRPRLLMTKMVRDQIQVNDEEVKQIYEFRYGKKVKVKIIMWPPDMEKVALREYEVIRKSDAEFERVARNQMDSTLAAAGGEIAPIARFGPGDNRLIEEEAFKLTPGELSRIIRTPMGWVVMKCIGHVEPEKGKDFEKEKPSLVKEVVDRKLSKEIPKLFESLKAEAKPQMFLKDTTKLSDIERDVQQELQQTGGTTPAVIGAPKK